jgi:RimJ/RimL family protein N-acetyltransferase
MSADLQPTLQGETLTLRPVREEDWDGLFRAASDPKIWEVHPAKDRYTEPVFRAFFADALKCGSALCIVDTARDEIVGSSRYYGFDPASGEVEIGWTFIARPYWGGRANRELKRLMLDHAFTFAETVLFWVGETNVRSRRAMEKIGGVLRPGIFNRSLSPVPHVIFEITKANYPAVRALLTA